MKVFVLLADGFEEIEALASVDVLRRAGIETPMVSVYNKEWVTSARNIGVKADLGLDELQAATEDVLFIPGGLKGVEGLEASREVVTLLKEHRERDGLLAAICAGPSLPGKLGLLKGYKAVCYPGFENALLGAQVQYDAALIDRNVVTGRGAGVALEFAFTLLEKLKGRDAADKVKKAMLFDR